jgi:phospholipid/cholesterol/gamma-HCH transport system permease protein
VSSSQTQTQTDTLLLEMGLSKEGVAVLRPLGAWTAAVLPTREAAAVLVAAMPAFPEGSKIFQLDLSALDVVDTYGALQLRAITRHVAGVDSAFTLEGGQHGSRTLIAALLEMDDVKPQQVESLGYKFVPALLGDAVISLGRDGVQVADMMGAVLVSLMRIVSEPRRFRVIAVVNQLERVAVHGLPIVLLMSFIVGAIVAQQGLFQLEKFGASAFVVDLLGILTFRELALLLTAIMVAGRSGSAFTAEIGSMKMREEIDALRVMGLDPVDILVVPRVLALIIGLPLLTVAASMASLTGGALVSSVYGGISLDLFIERLQGTVGVNTIMVGLIKAPFLALVIGLIACVEGLNVKGSAESLGRQTTASVVKAIFMVIVLDGLFAMFFAAIKY